MEVHAIQHWTGEVWRMVYLTNYGPDAADTFDEILGLTEKTVRHVVFEVPNPDFVATQARDFGVVSVRYEGSEQAQHPW